MPRGFLGNLQETSRFVDENDEMMTGAHLADQLNHRGWIVMESIGSADGTVCVDFLEDPARGYGFELLRTDPEDGGMRTAVGGLSSSRLRGQYAAPPANNLFPTVTRIEERPSAPTSSIEPHAA